MSNITRVGVDLAKHLIQVHAVDAAGRVVTNRALKRDKFLIWCSQLPPSCLVAMEACSGAHHWCRQLRERGLDARMIPAQFVAPYRIQGKSGKNDANDAAAVCEAASRPHMNFVPPKTGLTPSQSCSLHLAKYECTVRHLGKSLGKARHWQPLRSRYSTAQNTSYRSTVLGLVLRRTDSSIGTITENCSRVMSLGYFLVRIPEFSIRGAKS